VNADPDGPDGPDDPDGPDGSGGPALAARLSSVASSLDDLTARVSEAAGQLRRSGDDDLATDLDEVERSLVAASRRLATTLRAVSSRRA
jgi:hypothetical protein